MALDPRYRPARPSVRTIVAMQWIGPWYAACSPRATALGFNPWLAEKTGRRWWQVTRQVRDWPAPDIIASSSLDSIQSHNSFVFTKVSVTFGSGHQSFETPTKSLGNTYTRLETLPAKLLGVPEPSGQPSLCMSEQL